MNTAGIISGSLAFLLTVLFVPVVIHQCRRWQLFDQPGPLKIHSRPVPRLGGVAVVLAISASAIFAAPSASVHAWPFFAALGLVWVTGLIDDLRGLSALIRLAAQIAAGIVLWRAGSAVPLPINGAVGMIATCVFLVVFVNSFNFLDGADGLASGVAAIIAAVYALVPLPREATFSSVAACGVAAACVGFLFFNYPIAKSFLGDCGSTALGFCVAFLGLNFWRFNHSTSPQLVFPMLAAALPLLDSALAVVRRVGGGSSPLHGDRQHIYDLLLARGWPPRRVAATAYGVTAAFCAIAFWGIRHDSPQFWAAAAFSCCLLIAFALRLGALRPGGEISPRRIVTREIERDTTLLD